MKDEAVAQVRLSNKLQLGLLKDETDIEILARKTFT